MNEYIIVNKTTIQKRIEELEDRINDPRFKEIDHYKGQIISLKRVLAQSTPLISEIEKLVDLIKWYDKYSDVRPTKAYPTEKGNSYEWFEDYVSNLKLDI